jgi:hypothetical protein
MTHSCWPQPEICRLWRRVSSSGAPIGVSRAGGGYQSDRDPSLGVRPGFPSHKVSFLPRGSLFRMIRVSLYRSHGNGTRVRIAALTRTSAVNPSRTSFGNAVSTWCWTAVQLLQVPARQLVIEESTPVEDHVPPSLVFESFWLEMCLQ